MRGRDKGWSSAHLTVCSQPFCESLASRQRSPITVENHTSGKRPVQGEIALAAYADTCQVFKPHHRPHMGVNKDNFVRGTLESDVDMHGQCRPCIPRYSIEVQTERLRSVFAASQLTRPFPPPIKSVLAEAVWRMKRYAACQALQARSGTWS
jgi:hypothetical protein